MRKNLRLLIHTPQPKPRLSSRVKEIVVQLNVVTAEGILPACRRIRNTVGAGRVKPEAAPDDSQQRFGKWHQQRQ